jgi:cell wall-associated NlpC family hydrolase
MAGDPQNATDTTVPLSASNPVQVDDNLDLNSLTTTGLNNPLDDGQLPTVDYSGFTQNMNNSSMNPNGFSQQMAQLTNNVYSNNSNDSLPTGTGGATGTRAQVIKYAEKFLGTPYVWGGSSPGGFDCSGLVQYVMGKYGVKLPRISAAQARSGKRIGLDQLQAGDLVAWDENGRNVGADHIAIYIGNGQIIEAPHTGASVRISNLKGRTAGAWGVSLNY